jgi:hypothetical protein
VQIAVLLTTLCSCGRHGFEALGTDGGSEQDEDAGNDSQPPGSDSTQDPAGWTIVEPSATGANLYTVRAFAANNIWVAGDNGVTVQFDGTQWIDRVGPTTDVYKLWGTASDLWEVGALCEVQRWNGSAWSVVTVPNCGSASINAIAGAAANDFWLVGVSGTIIRNLNGTYTHYSESTNVDLFGVFALTTTDVYIVGTRGLIVHRLNGTALDESVPLNVTLTSVWGANANDLWVVGNAGTMYRKQNGGLWVKQTIPVTTNLYALWGTSATDIWAVGDGGVAIHYDGASWQIVAMPTTVALRSMTGVPGGGIRIVGDAGMMLDHP